MEPPVRSEIQAKIDSKTKPRGALGILETLAAQICQVQATLTPTLRDPMILVFAADHGAAKSGISAYPRTVTAQMVQNYLQGGAGINVFCRQHHIITRCVDAGVDWPEAIPAGLVNARIGPSTSSYLQGDAMTATQVDRCLTNGQRVVAEVVPPSSNVLGFGEIGIGNTASASLLMSALTGVPIADCTGPGTGLVGAALDRKIALLARAQAEHRPVTDARTALQYFGGFEIAEMTGAMLAGFRNNRLLLIDGFVASAALLCARDFEPDICANAVFCHQSDEPGHARLLAELGGTPLLQLGMRLGEGSGCAVAYPILESAVAFINEMASFTDAGVTTGTPEAEQ